MIMSSGKSCNTTSGKVRIYRGASKHIAIEIYREDDCGNRRPYDLTGITQAFVRFLKEDGTVLEKNMAPQGAVMIDGDAKLGLIKIILQPSDTALLKPGESLSFELEIQIVSEVEIFQFGEQLDVLNKLFT